MTVVWYNIKRNKHIMNDIIMMLIVSVITRAFLVLLYILCNYLGSKDSNKVFSENPNG